MSNLIPFEPTHGSSRKQCMNEPDYELQIDEIVSLHTDKHARYGQHVYTMVFHPIRSYNCSWPKTCCVNQQKEEE